jgi:hypothetical protein
MSAAHEAAAGSVSSIPLFVCEFGAPHAASASTQTSATNRIANSGTT